MSVFSLEFPPSLFCYKQVEERGGQGSAQTRKKSTGERLAGDKQKTPDTFLKEAFN